MSDQTNAAISFTENGNSQEEVQQPKYLTVAEAAALEDRIVRRVQGLTDKADSRIQKEVRQQIKTMEASLKAAGITMTPEQKAALQQNVINQTLTAETQPESSEAPPTQASAQGQQAPDPISLAGWEIMKDAGMNIDPGDPEVSLLDVTSPGKWLSSIPAAIAAKKARLTQQPTTPSRIPTNVGTGSVVPPPEGVGELTTRLQALQREPTKNYKEIAELSGRLRNLLPKK
jgi:hypothetical protein